mmetsp:Transcript_29980/g.82290  ORF Transcript_29980/g.82290 Transcript_29980/m.82290 type:complete len:136 (-) Transcript_29980:43-450(-)
MMNTIATIASRPARRMLSYSSARALSTRPIHQSWWVPESREFDILHEKVREDLNLDAAERKAPEPPVEPLESVAEEVPQGGSEPRLVVESQKWWPHETRGFDIDHDYKNNNNAPTEESQGDATPDEDSSRGLRIR